MRRGPLRRGPWTATSTRWPSPASLATSSRTASSRRRATTATAKATGGSGAKLFSAHDRVRNVEADHRVGAVVGESSVNAGHYTVEYDDGGREADVDGGSLRLEAFQIGQRVVLVRTDDQVPEAEAVGTVLKLDMDSAEAQQDGNGGGGGGVVRPGDTVTFTVSSDNANFDGCPGSTLAFSVGSEYTVKEVQGGFF